MTRLSDPELAQLARENDLTGDDVERAVATAIAASNGDPSYHVQVLPGPVADYQGLWGLDVIEHPEYAAADLHHPAVAARAMAGLVAATGGWKWCPAYRSGRFATYLERAVPAASTLPGIHEHRDIITHDQVHADHQRNLTKLAVLVDGFVRRSRERRHP